MSKLIDMSGQRFGMLTVIERYGTKNKSTTWKCVCDCGNEHIVTRVNLIGGDVKSCGCSRKGPGGEDISGQKFGHLAVIKKIRKWGNKFHWECVCDCGNTTTANTTTLKSGQRTSCGCMKLINVIKSSKERKGDKNPNWKGIGKFTGFDTYASRLNFIEEVRRFPDNDMILQVRCTYCGKWITPTRSQVNARLDSIYGNKNNIKGENRFYCNGNSCKSQCSIYRRYKFPKGFKQASSREVQPELRKLVFERDNHTCQKCGSNDYLHCHHINPVSQNPLESADLDNCITFCKKCHKEIHKTVPGCKYLELRCQ